MGKFLIIAGLCAIVIGVALVFKVPLPFGRLPGDISIKAGHFQVYFPIASCIIISIVLSLLFYLFGR